MCEYVQVFDGHLSTQKERGRDILTVKETRRHVLFPLNKCLRQLSELERKKMACTTTYLAPPYYWKMSDQIDIAFRSIDLVWLVLYQLMKSVVVPCALDDASDVYDDAQHGNANGGRYRYSNDAEHDQF